MCEVCPILCSCYKLRVPLVIDLPRSADVVILGGGFAGVATAWALAMRGVTDVVVVEREAHLGRFASGRGAGLGRQLAEDDALTALTVRGAQVLRASFPQAWTATGGVLSFDNVDHAQAYIERASRFGVPVEPITREMVLGHWPVLDHVSVAAALHIPSDGVIDTGVLLQAYAQHVQIACSRNVEQIIPLQGGARVVTSRGDIVGRFVVDATGAWAGQVVGDPPLASLKRHVYLLEAQAIAGSPFLWHLGACELYVRDAGANLLVSPCDSTLEPAADAAPDEEGEAKLRRALTGSSLQSAPIARAWACHRTFTPTGAMRLGRDESRPWLVHAVGLGGHGATASASVGETVAASLMSSL
jgi:glycine/D-amino acid oxidase-like deaminating enzyme